MEKNRFFEIVKKAGKYGIRSTKENDVDGKMKIVMPIIYDNILLVGNGTSPDEYLLDKKIVGIKVDGNGKTLYDEFRFSYTQGVPGSCDNLAIIQIQENLSENDYESKVFTRRLI